LKTNKFKVLAIAIICLNFSLKIIPKNWMKRRIVANSLESLEFVACNIYCKKKEIFGIMLSHFIKFSPERMFFKE